MIEAIITRNLTVNASGAGWVTDNVKVTLPRPYRTATVTSALVKLRGSGQTRASISGFEYEVYDKFGLPTGAVGQKLIMEPPPITGEDSWLKEGSSSETFTGLRHVTFELTAKDMFASAIFTVFVHRAPSIFIRLLAFLRRLLPVSGRG